MSTKLRPLRSVFLLAAEKECISKDSIDGFTDGCSAEAYYSKYACDNINNADSIIRKAEQDWGHNPEIQMFTKIYNPDGEFNFTSAWWNWIIDERGYYQWDYESRILALLLCAEMLRR